MTRNLHTERDKERMLDAVRRNAAALLDTPPP